MENNLNASDVADKLSQLAAKKIIDIIDDMFEDKANFIVVVLIGFVKATEFETDGLFSLRSHSQDAPPC